MLVKRGANFGRRLRERVIEAFKNDATDKTQKPTVIRRNCVIDYGAFLIGAAASTPCTGTKRASSTWKSASSVGMIIVGHSPCSKQTKVPTATAFK